MIHLSDELLESALAEIRQEELNNLPSDEELKNKYSIPKRFDRKILHLIRDERRSPWMRNLTHYAKRVAVFFLALLIAAGTTIMTVSAAREWFFKVISQVFPTHTQIDFTPAESLQEEIPFVAHAPEYIPDGYTMDGEPFIREPNRLVRIAYRNEDGGLIRFNQMFKGGTKVDPEDAYPETLQLNGHDALYIQKGETQMLYGYLDNALFFLYVRDPDLTKDDVLAIAQSIAPIDG